MDDREWKMAAWGRDWSEVFSQEMLVQGVCSFSDRDGINLSIPLGRLSKERTIDINGASYEVGESILESRLVGMTQDGYRLVLGDCKSPGASFSCPGFEWETIWASTIYSSKYEYDDTQPIVYAEMEVYGLRDWLGTTVPYGSNDGVIQIKDEKVECEIPLLESDELSVSIQYGCYRPRRWRDCFEVRTFAHIAINCPGGMTLDGLWSNVLWKTQSLFAFMYGFYPSVRALRVKFEGNPNQVSVYRQTYVSNDRKVKENSVPVSYQSLGDEGLRKIATRWFSLGQDERRAAELLTTLLGGWTMPLEMPLTAASAMMEALGRVHEKKVYSKKELSTIRDRIVAAAPENLRGRLYELIGMLNSQTYAKRLEAVYQECGDYASWLIEDWSTFLKRQKSVRNSGAHALDREGSLSVAVDHYNALILLAYCWFLRSFEIGDKALVHFESCGFLWGSRDAIHEMYSMHDGG